MEVQQGWADLMPPGMVRKVLIEQVTFGLRHKEEERPRSGGEHSRKKEQPVAGYDPRQQGNSRRRGSLMCARSYKCVSEADVGLERSRDHLGFTQ